MLAAEDRRATDRSLRADSERIISDLERRVAAIKEKWHDPEARDLVVELEKVILAIRDSIAS